MCLSHRKYEQIVHVHAGLVMINEMKWVVSHLYAVSIRRASLRLLRSARYVADRLEAIGGYR